MYNKIALKTRQNRAKTAVFHPCFEHVFLTGFSGGHNPGKPKITIQDKLTLKGVYC